MKNLLLIQPKAFLKKFYRGALWDVATDQNEIYLTFDDGPVPVITEWVLEELKKYNAKATFFCVGSNILKYPRIFERIIAEGHTVGNHTMNHVKGFKCTYADYLKEVESCRELVNNSLFRPPYGQIKPGQFKMLKNKGYKVVFWDVISYDYEQIPPSKCLQNAINNTVKGSIVLFHDSVKAEKNLRHVLPLFLKHFANLQFEFKNLSNA